MWSRFGRGAAPRWRVGLAGASLAASAVGAAAAADEGFRRCLQFWAVVLPIFAHYKFVDRILHPSPSAERTEAFERLHDFYSPIVRSATLRLRGYYLKVAQFLSMRDDYVPPQYLSWAKKLQDEAPVALSAPEAQRCVAAELGLHGLDAAFEDWSTVPIGSASIGQVYLARLRSSGERVAVKVQMPGAEHLFRVDIKTLKLFTSFAFPWAVDHMSELEAMFESEFDYALERENMERVRANVEQRWGKRVAIPKTYPELCSRRVLCMEYLEGEKLVDGILRRVRALASKAGRDPDEVVADHLEKLRTGKLMARSAYAAKWRARAWQVWQRLQGIEDINIPQLMETLMTIHGEQVFTDGLFNADPHPGNVLMLKDAARAVGLIDFGQVKELSIDFRIQLAKLMIALARRDQAEVVRLDKEMGNRTRNSKSDVRYRVLSFWLDRDTDDVTQGQSFHDFLAWAEAEDPLVDMRQELHLVMRCSCMIRNLALTFGIRLSTAEYWRPLAQALLQKHSITY
ncbi:unnamed protein product [Symbiodinium natans]|uniref:Protein kinase domain-containing protein n=1 Tax=Symbiodinium natans TaxID=878477 RepID=A0A812RUV3_9DINO|nr:unnamed protein product [Symbiodinium natans]